MAGSNEALLAAEARSTVLVKHRYIDVIVLSALAVGIRQGIPARTNPLCVL